jgi:hypothetical protein
MGPLGTTIKDYEEAGAKMCMPDASPSGAVKDTLFNVYQDLYDNGPAARHGAARPGNRGYSSGAINSGTNWKKNTYLSAKYAKYGLELPADSAEYLILIKKRRRD